MTPAFRYTILWIVGSLVLVVAAMTMLSGGYVDGHYVPSNADAFYHARRILDMVMTGHPVAQFDGRIHYPEGSWIPWPWGFDTVMATIVRWFGPFADESSAAAVLMRLPVAAAPIAMALLIWLWRQLGVSLAAAGLATLGFAALPLVFLTFAVGNVDHDFAELLWVLLTLCGGIWFFRTTSRVGPAVFLGLVLGSALAVHNGLFILQLPVLLAFAWRWVRHDPLPSPRVVLTFAVVLIGATVLASVESEPWRRGVFDFYLLSWFHTYVTACTALMLVLLAYARPRVRNIVWIGLVAAAAAVPIVGNVALGTRFIGGDLDALRGITETLSPYRLYALFGPAQSTRLFSWLMWLALPALLVNAFWVVRDREPGRQFFAIAAMLFLVLMQLQYRFGVFGIVPLLATLALLLDAASKRRPGQKRLHLAAAGLGLAIALMPTREVWTIPRAAGGDPFYADIRPGLMQLRTACEQQPGVVLAAIDDGHWIRYHTACSVIGDVFLLTAQDARKRREVEELLAMPPERLRSGRPDIGYVLVHSELELFVPVHADGSHGQGVLRWKSATLPTLTRALLGPADSLPSGYRVLWSKQLPDGRVLARLLEIEH